MQEERTRDQTYFASRARLGWSFVLLATALALGCCVLIWELLDESNRTWPVALQWAYTVILAVCVLWMWRARRLDQDLPMVRLNSDEFQYRTWGSLQFRVLPWASVRGIAFAQSELGLRTKSPAEEQLDDGLEIVDWSLLSKGDREQLCFSIRERLG